MTLAEYQSHLEILPFGKRLPAAMYVFREEGISFGAELDRVAADGRRPEAGSGCPAARYRGWRSFRGWGCSCCWEGRVVSLLDVNDWNRLRSRYWPLIIKLFLA